MRVLTEKCIACKMIFITKGQQARKVIWVPYSICRLVEISYVLFWSKKRSLWPLPYYLKYHKKNQKNLWHWWKSLNHNVHVQLLNMCMTVVGNNCTIIVNFQDTFYVYRSSKILHVVPHKGQESWNSQFMFPNLKELAM